MTRETRTDVFERLLDDWKIAGNKAAEEHGVSWEVTNHDLAVYRKQFAAAPAEVVKVPEDMYEWIATAKGMRSFGVVDAFQNAVMSIGREYYYWLIGNQDLFAAAWLAYPNIEVEK